MHNIAHQRLLVPGQRPVGPLMKRTGTGDGGRHVVTEDVQQDTLYLSEVAVKGQTQPFMLDFDSGSSDLFVRVLSDIAVPSNFSNNPADTCHRFCPKN